MLADAQPPEVQHPHLGLRRPCPSLRLREVQPAEEQRALGQLAQFLGPAAQPVPQHLGVGAGGGDVLAGDDVLPGPVDHGGEDVPAVLVVGAFEGEGVLEGGFGRRHSSNRTG